MAMSPLQHGHTHPHAASCCNVAEIFLSLVAHGKTQGPQNPPCKPNAALHASGSICRTVVHATSKDGDGGSSNGGGGSGGGG